MAVPKISGLLTSGRMAEPEVWIMKVFLGDEESASAMAVADGTWSQSAKSVLMV
jgi:hypothetical protein